MKHLLASAVLALCLMPLTVQAASSWPCWEQAARRYGVDVSLLYAIARVESGARSGIVSAKNGNGSYDIGLMQINSWWLPTLRQYGITEQRLRGDACLNLNVGAWVLSKTIREHGLNWRGVGAYNARTDSKRAIYARKVANELARIRKERRGQTGALADAGRNGGAR